MLRKILLVAFMALMFCSFGCKKKESSPVQIDTSAIQKQAEDVKEQAGEKLEEAGKELQQ